MSDRPVPETGEPRWRGTIDSEQPDLPCLNCGRPYYEHEPREHLACSGPDRVVGEREERLRGALEIAKMERDWLLGAWAAGVGIPQAEAEAEFLKWSSKWRSTAVEAARSALASSPSPPLLDGAECHELYSMWLAHNASEGVDSGHPLVTAGEKLARRMDPGHPRFSAPVQGDEE